MTSTGIVSLVERIAVVLTQSVATIAPLVELLGDVDRKYAGSGYYLQPRDERLESVWVAIRVVVGEQEDVAHVQLELKADNELTLGDLNRTFGSWSAQPPAPRAVRHTVAYYPEPPTSRPHRLAVFAETDDIPSAESVSVRSITLRRDGGPSA